MNLKDIRQRLESKSIFLHEDTVCERLAVVGYEKKFRWLWFATQLNTFVIAIDYGEEPVTEAEIQTVLDAAFGYARNHYRGWPRGFQSAVAVIAILLGEDIDAGAAQYCAENKAGKKWAGFPVPVVVNSRSGEVHAFAKNPMWGRIYYPHFKKLITELTAG